jgi:glycosyltransferase involved in cell wall biosynthesis
MNVLLIEPFYSGSHQKWAEGLMSHTTHNMEILSLPGRHWKWRMHGGAISLAHSFIKNMKSYDLIIVSDMLDLATFKGLTAKYTSDTPFVVYFHENQLTYPWSPEDPDVKLKRDNHYAFINYSSALSADHCFFNSLYHRSSFINHLPSFLSQFPDHKNEATVYKIEAQSSVLSLGIDLKPILSLERKSPIKHPILLWNHRWEYDKNPHSFFKLCQDLKSSGQTFQLIVCGEHTTKYPEIFSQAKDTFSDVIIHWGYAQTREQYIQLLSNANVIPVTSNQDFFGGSVVEGIAAGCIPLLPDRLAYPEHLPTDLASSHLYDSMDELFEKMKTDNILRLSENIDQLRSHVSRYDWSSCIEIYDKTFSGSTAL